MGWVWTLVLLLSSLGLGCVIGEILYRRSQIQAVRMLDTLRRANGWSICDCDYCERWRRT